ncbi:hypothetical protein LXL04_001602 [Taraxacum kok-saghyz]
MDQKPWPPRKKLIAVKSEAGISINGNEEKNIPYNKHVALKQTAKNLHKQVVCLQCECKSRNELMSEHVKTAQEFITGRENSSLRNHRHKLSSFKAELIENVSNQISEATTEYHALKRELKIRTLNADVANRQETGNLEGERHRLRLLVKKRVPTNGKSKSVDKSMSLMIKKLTEMEEENKSLKESLCEREKEIRKLSRKIDKNFELENKIVNLKLMNVDLDQQLYASKVEIKEAFRKVSVLELELEDKSQQYEGLETTCLELQLQLATVSTKNEVTEDVKQIQTITSSEKLKTSQTPKLTNNKKSNQNSSLRDIINSSTINEILKTTDTKDPSGTHYNTCNRSCGLKNVVPKAWAIVPRIGRSKGIELLWKLLLRRKKGGGNKKKLRRIATDVAIVDDVDRIEIITCAKLEVVHLI